MPQPCMVVNEDHDDLHGIAFAELVTDGREPSFQIG